MGYQHFCTKPSEQSLFFRASQNESNSCMLQSKLTKTEISQWDINVSTRNLQNRACFSEPVKMSPNSCMLQSETYKNINISAWDINVSAWIPSEQGSCFLQASQHESKQWYATIKTYKNINISVGYQCFCIETFRTGLIFLNRSKWVQTVVCYNLKLTKT